MLALGVGITTAMFTLVDSLLLRPVPFHDASHLAKLWMSSETGGRTLVTPPVLQAWRESPALKGAESATSETALIEVGDSVIGRGMAAITPGLFDLLGGVRPIRGRLFDASEGIAGQRDRVILSETLWRTVFGSDPDLIGRSLIINRERMTVVGILPAAFRFPSANTVLWRPTDLRRTSSELAAAYVRFAPGMVRDDALSRATNAAHAVDPKTTALHARVSNMVGDVDSYSRRSVPVLAAAVALLFLVLCANVCGLLLARSPVRHREFSLRVALGASRGRLVCQTAMECRVLGALGVLLGTGFAWGFVAIARGVLPDAMVLQTLNPLDIDSRALAVTSCAGLMATLTSGLLPAWVGTRVRAGESLRVVDRGSTETRRSRALTRLLLQAEIALACTLLVGATLLTRSFINLTRADRGLVTTNVTTAWLSLGLADPNDAVVRRTLTQNIEDELRQLPGVHQVAWSYGLPPQGGSTYGGTWVSDAPSVAPLDLTLESYIVSPEFFALYEIPIIRDERSLRLTPLPT